MTPAPVLAGAAAVALAVPLLGWALFARPQDAAARTRANLARGLALSGAGGSRPGWHGH
jgi:tight adherence protein C